MNAFKRTTFTQACFAIVLALPATARAGYFGRGQGSSIERLMRTASALAKVAAVSDDWVSREDLRTKMLAEIVEAQTVLSFRTLSRHDYQPTAPSLPLVLAVLERHLNVREREVLVRIYPQLIKLWLNEKPWLERGLAYVKLGGDQMRLPHYIGYRIQNFSDHCAGSLKRVGFYVLRNLFGAREGPNLSFPLRDYEEWRGALAVASFKFALETSCGAVKR